MRNNSVSCVTTAGPTAAANNELQSLKNFLFAAYSFS